MDLLFASLLVLLMASTLSARAGCVVLFESGFESPPVSGRTPRSAGGDPSQSRPAHPGEAVWQRFEDQPNLGAEEGSVVAGLTNEIARTGAQSLFIEASKLCAPYIGAQWVTRPIPVEGGKSCRVNFWGRNDAKNPLVSEPAQLLLRLQVDFFAADGATEVGSSQYLLLPLPGFCGHMPMIVPDEWSPLGFEFKVPAGARSMRVSFRCDSRSDKGSISGVAYFDDFSVTEEPPERSPGQKEIR